MIRQSVPTLWIIVVFWISCPGSASEAGADIYQTRCAVCHTGTDKNTGPSLDSIQAMSSAETVSYTHLTLPTSDLV